ncbi:MAG: CoA pyrophosphatase [Pseudomonadota bacterium]
MRQRIVESLRSLGASDGDVPADGDFKLNPASAARAKLTPAAVLVPIVERTDGATVLLTERSARLKKHAGQVSFPGGRAEPDDADRVATALRETHEEIGLGAEFVDVVGRLDDYQTGTGYRVTPVVGFVRPGFSLAVDPGEVSDVFEVPLDFVLDSANHSVESRPWNGGRRHYYVLRFAGRYIWGATAGMLVNLSRRVSQLEQT